VRCRTGLCRPRWPEAVPPESSFICDIPLPIDIMALVRFCWLTGARWFCCNVWRWVASHLREGSAHLSGGDLKRSGDEFRLGLDVAATDISDLPLPLPLPHHRHRLVACRCSSVRPEATEGPRLPESGRADPTPPLPIRVASPCRKPPRLSSLLQCGFGDIAPAPFHRSPHGSVRLMQSKNGAQTNRFRMPLNAEYRASPLAVRPV
jgi:hypothetical protein